MCKSQAQYYMQIASKILWAHVLEPQAWKAGHKRECVPPAAPPAPAAAPTAPSPMLAGIPWEYAGHLQAAPSAGYEHVSQRGVFDILRKRDTQGHSASVADMFARLSCAEIAPSVFESTEAHCLELE